MFFIILLLFASSFAIASEHTLDYYLYNSKESFLRDARIYISTLLEDTDSKPSSPFPGAHYTIPEHRQNYYIRLCMQIQQAN